jgi:hypothetical protein
MHTQLEFFVENRRCASLCRHWNDLNVMSEDPSISAVGVQLDERAEIGGLAYRYSEAESQ